MIEFEGVRKTLNEQRVLDGIDLVLEEGRTHVLMGPSGTGKTVLLKHIVGLLDPDEGDVRVDGMSVPGAGAARIREIRSRVSYVFQHAALFDSLTVRGNILLGLPPGTCERPETDCEAIAREAMDQVNLGPEVLGLLPAELSGGMKKRVAIARAIVGEQKYVLYDEPTTGLDPVNSTVIDHLIARLNRELGGTSVIVTHDVEQAFFLGDHIVLLSRGRVRARGTPDELRASRDPAVRRFLEGRPEKEEVPA